jgi:redox-sensitive bicupin YhaK (pirin superfamily)
MVALHNERHSRATARENSMSWQPSDISGSGDERLGSDIETVIVPRARDIGGFEVRRALPSAQRRMVGPFVFFDQMGPAQLRAGQGIDVRPHPHIGLATVTYLFKGMIVHRDSLGSLQPILPGDVNWMTAGRGIVHSERSDMQRRQKEDDLFGLQLWVALPQAHEETDPQFVHHARATLPVIEGEGVIARVIAGSALGRTAPVKTLSDLFYVDLTLDLGARFVLRQEYEERAAYVLDGTVEIDGAVFEPGRMLVFKPDCDILLKAITSARVVVLGGAPMDGPRHIWWNFVSSRKERIEHAKADWQNNRFGVEVPGETEFIPLPDK